MKKGYVYVILFSAFIASMLTLKYRIILEKDPNLRTGRIIIIQVVWLFISFVVPLLFLVRWYYKNKR